MKVRTSVLRSFALLALSSLTFAACDDETPVVTPPPQITVSVVPQNLELTLGNPATASGQLTAVVLGGTSATNRGVNFTSSNTAVAEVSATGLVTAKAPGQATITARSTADANAAAVASVVVNAAPTGPPPSVTLTLVPATAAVQTGGTVQLVSIVNGSTNQNVRYTTSDTAIARVSATGLVTAGTRAGTAVITARALADSLNIGGNAVRTSVITVTEGPGQAPVTISITPTAATVLDGGTQQFVATASRGAVRYSSADTNVATIDSITGVATGNNPGVAVITATSVADRSVSVTATLTVASVAQPSISILRVAQGTGATATPVSVGTTVNGNLEVVVNVSAGTQTNIQRVEVQLDNDDPATNETADRCAQQTFNPPLAPTQGVAQLTLVCNTAQLDAAGQAIFMNGAYTLKAVAYVTATSDVATAVYGTLNLQNTNVVSGSVVFDNSLNDSDNDPASNRMVGGGLVWRGGTATITLSTGVFTGNQITNLAVGVDLACDGTNENTQTVAIANGAGVATFSEADTPGQIDHVSHPVVCFRITPTSATDAEGLTVPLTNTSARGGLTSTPVPAPGGVTPDTTAAEGPNQNVFSIDNVPPIIAAGFDVPASVIANNSYAGNTTTFARTTLQNATATDAGVGGVTYRVFFVSSSATTTTQANMAAAVSGLSPISATNRPASSTTFNDAYRLILEAKDTLGNVAYARSSTFGMDTENPTFTVRTNSLATGSINTTRDVLLAVTDTFSGPRSARVRAANFSVREADTDGGVEARCLLADGTLGAVVASYAAATAITAVPAACTFDVATSNIGGQTEDADVLHPNTTTANEGYFLYAVRAVDRADNVSDQELTLTTLNDITSPTGRIDIITINRINNTIRLQGEIQENVDLLNFDTRLVFPGLAGQQENDDGTLFAAVNVPDEVPFIRPVPVGDYGLQDGLLGIRPVDETSGAVRDLTDQTGNRILANAYGFGMTDVAQNFGFLGEPIAPEAGTGAVLTPGAFDASFRARPGDLSASPGATNTFTLDRSSGPTSTTMFAEVRVGATEQNPIQTVYFFIVHPGNDLTIGTPDDYNQLVSQVDGTGSVVTGLTDRTFTYSTPVTTGLVPRNVDNPNQTYGMFAVAVRSGTGSAVMSDVLQLTIRD